jgi:20S proteasome subunit alpha 7
MFGCGPNCVFSSCVRLDTKTPELYMIEPSGMALRYYGCAAGKGSQAAKTEIEKLIVRYGTPGLSCREAVKEIARM